MVRSSKSSTRPKTILRNACTVCGVHMHGPITNPKHAFNGLTFVHAERLQTSGWSPRDSPRSYPPSSKTGTKPEVMDGIRARLKELKLEPYDALSPQLMDLLAANAVKVKRVARRLSRNTTLNRRSNRRALYRSGRKGGSLATPAFFLARIS